MNVRISLTDLLNLARYYYERADVHHQSWQRTGRQSDMNNYHALTTKALDAEHLAELYAQEGLKNTLKITPQLTQHSFAALNPAKIEEEVSQYKSHKKGEISEAEVVERESKESNRVNRKMVEDLFDFELEILNKKTESNKKESPAVKNYRTRICAAIAKGNRNEMVNMLSSFTFKDKEYTTDRAHRFINMVKEQFNVPEPSKNLKDAHNKKWSVEKIPKGKYIHAEYTYRGSEQEEIKKAYLRRHQSRTREMYDEFNEFACHLDDVRKWRHIFEYERKNLGAPF